MNEYVAYDRLTHLLHSGTILPSVGGLECKFYHKLSQTPTYYLEHPPRKIELRLCEICSEQSSADDSDGGGGGGWKAFTHYRGPAVSHMFFVLLSSIIICRLYRLPLSEQDLASLQLRVCIFDEV
jgi:hypothetical protein